MDPFVDFIRRAMGMAVEKPVHARRHLARKDVDEVKAFPVSLEIEAGGGVEREIIIAQNHGQPGVDGPELIEDRFLADIAQMPDFVDPLEKFLDLGNPAIMGVGDDSDAISLLVHHMAQA